MYITSLGTARVRKSGASLLFFLDNGSYGNDDAGHNTHQGNAASRDGDAVGYVYISLAY